jgi:hypothetical protein
MNNTPNVIIDYSISFFTKLDILIFSHTNKRFRKQSQNYLLRQLKHKDSEASCKFAFENDTWLRDECSYIPKNKLFSVDVVYEGYLNVLIYLKESNHQLYWNICKIAALNRHEQSSIEVLKWARKNGYEWDGWTCANAARNGNLEVLKFGWPERMVVIGVMIHVLMQLIMDI